MRTYHTLRTKDGKWQWKTIQEGIPLSPEFTTEQCAILYAERMPMILDSQWREFGTWEEWRKNHKL